MRGGLSSCLIRVFGVFVVTFVVTREAIEGDQVLQDIKQRVASNIDSEWHSGLKTIMERIDGDLKGNRLTVASLNVFLKTLNDLHCDKGMAIRHLYYYRAITEHHVTPNVITFNLLLKGVRLSEPPLFKFVSFFLGEMESFYVLYDDCTFNELISLCARFPCKSNMEVARSWLEAYIGRPKYEGRGKSRKDRVSCFVLNSYLNLLVQAGDYGAAWQFIDWLQKRNIWNDKLEHTLEKMQNRRYKARKSSSCVTGKIIASVAVDEQCDVAREV